jgi:hypothetical protein
MPAPIIPLLLHPVSNMCRRPSDRSIVHGRAFFDDYVYFTGDVDDVECE